MFEEDIRRNIDELYKNRNRNLEYNPGCLKQDKNLDLKPAHKLTGREKHAIDKDKKKYADYLLTIAENKIIARRAHMRLKTLAEC